MLRAAVIGLGVGERHALGYARSSHVSLGALCDRNPQRLAEVAQRITTKSKSHAMLDMVLTTNPHEVLSDPSIDVVSIATHDDTHCSLAIAAMRAGKHVMLEKPMALNDKELISLQKAHEDSGVVLSSNMVLRTSPRFRKVKEMIERGTFGDLIYLEGDYTHNITHRLTTGWRAEVPYYSPVLGGGVHLIDLLLWLSNDTAWSVTALNAKRATLNSAYRYSDVATVLFNTKSGILMKSSTVFTASHPHFHALKVQGTEASFVNTLNDGVLYHLSTNATAEQASLDAAALGSKEAYTVDSVLDPYPGYTKEGMIDNFIATVQGKEVAMAPFEQLFATMRVCLAAEQSMKSGKTVTLN